MGGMFRSASPLHPKWDERSSVSTCPDRGHADDLMLMTSVSGSPSSGLDRILIEQRRDGWRLRPCRGTVRFRAFEARMVLLLRLTIAGRVKLQEQDPALSTHDAFISCTQSQGVSYAKLQSSRRPSRACREWARSNIPRYATQATERAARHGRQRL
ncbi:unnamed protein product [Mycena citricolor]|uniref:Uncharacterized protein n=1 Tax=Mycena citricolor TaxID=2018698 RepID=A0AAD2Q0C5_9AGAR|nr:unnamed protein product [Mycena citricolor]